MLHAKEKAFQQIQKSKCILNVLGDCVSFRVNIYHYSRKYASTSEITKK